MKGYVVTVYKIIKDEEADSQRDVELDLNQI